MTGNVYGVSSYQQMNQAWKSQSARKEEKSTDYTGKNDKATGKTDIEVKEWKPVSSQSSLVPTTKSGYGTVIGDVNLSDKAKDYYDKLKSKFHGMDFILVSKDMKSQVAANAAAYGNALKPVVLIDDEKLERMANDESYRKKYEGIIAMSEKKLQEAKNSLTSSGANVKNFGMSVGKDGRMSFFATIEKANQAQTKALEKRQAEKKAAKAKEKKQAEKKAWEERLQKHREENSIKESDTEDMNEETVADEREYVTIKADTVEDLISKVSRYASDNSYSAIMTEEERKLGQNFDFKG